MDKIPSELNRTVTKNQEAKATEINAWRHAFDLQYLMPYQGAQGSQVWILRDMWNNTFPSIFATTKYRTQWKIINKGFEEEKQAYDMKRSQLNLPKLQADYDVTGRGYDIFPKVSEAISKYEQYLAEMTAVMREVEYDRNVPR